MEFEFFVLQNLNFKINIFFFIKLLMKFVILMNELLELRITETHLTNFTYVNVRIVRT